MKFYFNHSLMEDISREEAFPLFKEIIDLRTFCKEKKLMLYFYEGLWDIKIENIDLYSYLLQFKDRSLVLLIQAVKNGPFYPVTPYQKIDIHIEPHINDGNFRKILLSICFQDRQKEMLSFCNEINLSEKVYRLRKIGSSDFIDVLNFKGKNELITYLNSQLQFKNIKEVFQRITEETQNIIILPRAWKSAGRHDFRNFYSEVYSGIIGLEKTELNLILENKNEIQRQKAFFEKYHLEISKETSMTLKTNAEDRTFEVEGSGKKLFEWHIKIDGNRTRIHYWIDKTNKKVYIGHCGKHLPTSGG